MHWESQRGRYPRDPRLGHRPGISYIPVDRGGVLRDLYTTKDGFISTSTSNLAAIDPTKKLIVLLGGSVAMGLGATRNEFTIAARLASLCDQYKPGEYCVVNAACAAYCSWQEFLRYSLELSDLNPHTVISISSWNDFIHSSIGNRYNGQWFKNHDRSIDDLSDFLIGLDDSISAIDFIHQKLRESTFGRLLFKVINYNRARQRLTDNEIRWGYDTAKFQFKPHSVANYLHNMNLINAIASSTGSRFICLLQPRLDTLLGDCEALRDLRRLTSIHSEFISSRDAFFSKLCCAKLPDYIQASPSISPYLYVDHCHLGDQGQLMLTQYLFNLLSI